MKNKDVFISEQLAHEINIKNYEHSDLERLLGDRFFTDEIAQIAAGSFKFYIADFLFTLERLELDIDTFCGKCTCSDQQQQHPAPPASQEAVSKLY